MEQKPMPYLCMGLSRLIGGIFFTVFGLILFYYLNDKWELGIQNLGDIQKLCAKSYAAMIISIIIGLIGLIIGQVIGAAIKIKSDSLAEHITIGWHYLANTTIIWLMFNGVSVFLILGEETKFFLQGIGKNYFLTVFIIAAIGSQLIVWSLYVGGKIINSGRVSFGEFLTKTLPIAISITMGVFQFKMYELNILPGILCGFILPFILIPISAQMWRKDSMRRRAYPIL